MCAFGLAPHFNSILMSKVKSQVDYVLLFDESLNSELHSKQVDIHIRFWDQGQVNTRYLTSEFIGHGTADVLHEKLLQCVQNIGYRELLQLSMDGPNVNWKTFYVSQ